MPSDENCSTQLSQGFLSCLTMLHTRILREVSRDDC
jgi:hypothetical protein